MQLVFVCFTFDCNIKSCWNTKRELQEEPQAGYQRVRYQSQKSTTWKAKPADKKNCVRKIETKPWIRLNNINLGKRDNIKKRAQEKYSQKQMEGVERAAERRPAKLTNYR